MIPDRGYTGQVAHRRSQAARRQHNGARRRRTGAASEEWLLLIGIVAAIVIAIGMISRWPFGNIDPRPAEPLTIAAARASNAGVPIVRKRRVAAASYRFAGGPAERAQATECLATAALYEVGNAARGQRAVIQVILNRVRTRGFPKTICGVVYQGYDRATGCQFSFTCDGSFTRRPVHLGWRQARRAARRALRGDVFADVGRATDYHADWIVPYWRDSMVKIARVDTHLFYIRS